MKQQNILFMGFVLFLLVIGGGFIFFQNQPSSKMMKKDEQMFDQKEESVMEQKQSGKILAGKSSPFVEFNQADYENVLESGKIVFLDFYANWCPICRGEAPELESGFNSLTTDQVVGFRLNYKDSDTDENEKKLAEEFGITYQHTKLILKDKKIVLNDGEVWDKERFLEEINKNL